MANIKKKEKHAASNMNKSSEKLLVLLEYLSEQNRPVRLLDISGDLGMNTSTASRFLTALQAQGYVAQDIDSGRYGLTYKVCRIANNVSSRIDMRNIAVPYLKSMAKSLGCTGNLIVEYDYSVMYLEVVTSPNQILIRHQLIGGIAPLHCTGAGKILLTEFSDQRLEELVKVKGLHQYTDYTITTMEGLKKELDRIRTAGYAYDNEECELGTRCVAAPIRDYTNKIIAAISVNGPISKMTDEFIDSNLNVLQGTARRISAHLGYEAAASAPAADGPAF